MQNPFCRQVKFLATIGLISFALFAQITSPVPAPELLVTASCPKSVWGIVTFWDIVVPILIKFRYCRFRWKTKFFRELRRLRVGLGAALGAALGAGDEEKRG